MVLVTLATRASCELKRLVRVWVFYVSESVFVTLTTRACCELKRLVRVWVLFVRESELPWRLVPAAS